MSFIRWKNFKFAKNFYSMAEYSTRKWWFFFYFLYYWILFSILLNKYNFFCWNLLIFCIDGIIREKKNVEKNTWFFIDDLVNNLGQVKILWQCQVLVLFHQQFPGTYNLDSHFKFATVVWNTKAQIILLGEIDDNFKIFIFFKSKKILSL